MTSPSVTLTEVLEVRDAPLEVPAAWALLHNAALFVQGAHKGEKCMRVTGTHSRVSSPKQHDFRRSILPSMEAVLT